MNRITTIAAIALSFAAAGSAIADEITIDTVQHVSTKTRAEVQAELAAFKQQGVNPWSRSYDVRTGFKSERTRADVMAELNAARASGELASLSAQDSGSAYLAQARRAGAATDTQMLAGKSAR